jgi:hypothetical protein
LGSIPFAHTFFSLRVIIPTFFLELGTLSPTPSQWTGVIASHLEACDTTGPGVDLEDRTRAGRLPLACLTNEPLARLPNNSYISFCLVSTHIYGPERAVVIRT